MTLSRRDFLKLASMGVAATALSACVEGQPGRGDLTGYLPFYGLGLEFPTSPFRLDDDSRYQRITYFGDQNQYRVVELDPSNLGLWDPSANPANQFELANYQAAAEVVGTVLSRYEKIIRIEEAIRNDPYRPNEVVWKPLRVPGSSIHTDTARAKLEEEKNYLQPRWLVDEQSRTIAGALLHNLMYSRDLDPIVRNQIIAELADPAYLGFVIGTVDLIKEAGNQSPDLPPMLPLETQADLHCALYQPPRDSQICETVLRDIMVASGTMDCIFIPKVDPNIQKTLEHVKNEEFFELAPQPKVYYVVSKDAFGQPYNTIYVTHDDQVPGVIYNHNFPAPFDLAATEPDSWIPVATAEECRQLTEIHNIAFGDQVAVYQYNPEKMTCHLIPNDFTGSPKLGQNEPNIRLAWSIAYKNDPAQPHPDLVLLAKQFRDVAFPLQSTFPRPDRWLTDVTDTIKKYKDHTKYYSKLGLTPPAVFFNRLFRGLIESNPELHSAILPSHPDLLAAMLSMYYEAGLNHKLDDVGKLNWAFATGEPVPLYDLSGTDFGQLLSSLGFKAFQDDITATPYIDNNGIGVKLYPGEALPLNNIFLTDNQGDTYILVGGIGRDDGGNFFNALRNSLVSDKITHAYAIKLEDALKHITRLDPEDNILEAMKDIVTIGAVIGVFASTIIAPEFLPGILLKTSLSASKGVNVMTNLIITMLKNMAGKGLSILAP